MTNAIAAQQLVIDFVMNMFELELVLDATDGEAILLYGAVFGEIGIVIDQAEGTAECAEFRRTPPVTLAANGAEISLIITVTSR